jgi:ankyrin repeat protein
MTATMVKMLLRVALGGLLVVTVSAQADRSRDALFAAIHRGAVGEVERLIAGGAKPNSIDADGTPALMAATLFADTDMVGLLLEHGADPNGVGPAGTTALMWAIPNLPVAKVLVSHGANVNAKSASERTPVMVAASYPGTIDLLRLLIEQGTDLRAQDRTGINALALAVRSSDVEVVRFLVERGLDPKALSPAALRSAFLRRDRATTDYLMSKGLNPAPEIFITAATWEPPELLARWIQAGADVNAAAPPAQYGRTPLLTAVTSEAASADTLKLLLDRGADPNARTTEGESPLDWALYKNDRSKIQVLEERGAMRGNGPRREEIAAPSSTGGIGGTRASLTNSVARLLDVAPSFREKTNCISCHHNAMPALAAATAKRKGIEINEAQAHKNLDDILMFFQSSAPRMMLGDPAVGGEALTAGYAQMALAASDHPGDSVTATIAHWLLARQMPDGSWLGNGINRPPSEYSTISHTAIAVGGLKAYPLPGRQKQISESLQRARQWLVASDPQSAEERGMRLMGLVWSDAPGAQVAAAIKGIRDRQEANGGWSQFARTAPDAYATGLSLYALHIANVSSSDDTYRKGVAFLLGSQYPDGTWLVKTHAFPVQRYFESGFPFGRHQWISAAGTGWASMAIAQTLPDAKPNQRLAKRP